MTNKSVHFEKHRRRAGGSHLSTNLTFLLIGGGIGAVLALLFAPKPRPEVSGDVAEVTRTDSDRASATASQIRVGASEYYQAARARTSEYYAAVAKQTEDLAKVAREAGSGFVQ